MTEERTTRQKAYRLTLFGLIGVGIGLAIYALLAGDPWNAFATSGLLAVCIGIFAIGDLAKHRAIRVGTWIVAPIATLSAIAYLWFPPAYSYDEAYSGPTALNAFYDWTLGFWWFVALVVGASLLSLTWRKNMSMKYLYWATMGLGSFSALAAYFFTVVGEGESIIFGTTAALSVFFACIIVMEYLTYRRRAKTEDEAARVAEVDAAARVDYDLAVEQIKGAILEADSFEDLRRIVAEL